MSVLPEVSELKAVRYDYFPTRWQAVVWRNWGYVPTERLAKVLETSCGELKEAAELLGLNPEEPLKAVWGKQGYLTLIRDNWHLCTYEQLLVLLDVTEETLAFILKEDDFLWVKLGWLKPTVEAPKYAPLTEAQKEQTKAIANLLKDRFPAGDGAKDNGFEFIQDFYVPLKEDEYVLPEKSESENLRMVYPYFALYGDTLIDENIDPFPERLLMEYAKAGINGIWMQGVLYQLVEFSFDPSLSEGWEIRLRSLRRLVAKAKKFGIGIYMYLNEPRSMPERFFEEYPHLKGEKEGDFYAMCTSTPEVQEYLYNSVKMLFEKVPELAGFFSITMSENLTNCFSRLEGRAISCPRCKERAPWEVVAEVNNLMAKGAHDAVPSAKAIVWTWGWPDDGAKKMVPLLKEGQIVQCTSEEAMQFCIGGVEGSVLDYSMSLCGPGERSKDVWKIARDNGLQVSAKVQINNTWEMSAVPYIPVFDKIEQHIHQLKEQGVQHLHAGWTLGGYPSPNMRLAAWLIEGKGTAKDFLIDWLGEDIGIGVYEAQRQLSQAFSNFPFHLDSLYFGPQNCAPMAPFFLQNTGYKASMIGYPYDDIESWRGIYPKEIYEEQYRKLYIQWKKGVELLVSYQGRNPELDELIFMAQVVLCHYESTYHHIQFANRRGEDIQLVDAACKQDLLRIVREEMDTVQTVIHLRLKDSRVGYESSNHYYYTLQDLKEKMINLAYCEQKLQAYEESGLDFVLDFDADRDIKLLQITDTQIIDSAQRRYDERLTAEEIRMWATDQMDNVLFNELDTLIRQEEPDLILLTGDNVYGEFDDKGTSFEKLVNFMESYQIPWAPVFGNHDNETRLGVTWQCQKFEEAKYCIFKRRNEIGGNSNYSIGIAVGGEIQRIIFMMDTNGCSQMQNVERAEDREALTAEIMLHDTQLGWYQDVAAKVNAYAKAKIPSLMCFHVGDAGESSFNQYIYTHLQESGTDGVFFGHRHRKSDSVVWQGIRWTFGLKTGRYDSSPEQTGGTIITLNKSDFTVKHIVITPK